MKTIHEAVAEKITNSAGSIKDTLVNKVADIEITRRVNILSTALEINESLERELKKINRDDVTMYTNGTPTTSMSKDRFELIQKIKGKIGELSAAVDKALVDNTDEVYNKVNELNTKFKDGGNKNTSSENSSKQ